MLIWSSPSPPDTVSSPSFVMIWSLPPLPSIRSSPDDPRSVSLLSLPLIIVMILNSPPDPTHFLKIANHPLHAGRFVHCPGRPFQRRGVLTTAALRPNAYQKTVQAYWKVINAASQCTE